MTLELEEVTDDKIAFVEDLVWAIDVVQEKAQI